MHELKEEAKKEIIIKRNNMKTKIMNMRKKNERKKNMLKQKLMSVRTEMSQSVTKKQKWELKQFAKIVKMIKIKSMLIANITLLIIICTPVLNSTN